MQGLTPVRKTTMIGTLALLVALVAAWMLVLSPRSDAITAANEKVTGAQQANQALRTQIMTLHQRQDELPALRKTSAALDRRFPPTAEQAKLFKMITSAGAAAGIAPQFIQGVLVEAPTAIGSTQSAQLPGVASPIGQIAAQKVTINVQAPERQMRAFVKNLENLPRAFAVETISLTKQAANAGTTGTGAAGTPVTPTIAPDTQTATITGSMYVMPSVHDPSATKAGASATNAG
jgi:Tfp pilus assembly protein PilO